MTGRRAFSDFNVRDSLGHAGWIRRRLQGNLIFARAFCGRWQPETGGSEDHVKFLMTALVEKLYGDSFKGRRTLRFLPDTESG